MTKRKVYVDSSWSKDYRKYYLKKIRMKLVEAILDDIYWKLYCGCNSREDLSSIFRKVIQAITVLKEDLEVVEITSEHTGLPTEQT